MEHIQDLIDLIRSEALSDLISEVIQTGTHSVDIVVRPGVDWRDIDSVVGDFQLEYVNMQPQLYVQYVDVNGNQLND